MDARTDVIAHSISNLESPADGTISGQEIENADILIF